MYLSHVWLFVTPWTAANQAPLSVRFPRQEYWSGLTTRLQGILPSQRSNSGRPALHEDSLPSEPPGNTLRLECWTKYRIITLCFEGHSEGTGAALELWQMALNLSTGGIDQLPPQTMRLGQRAPQVSLPWTILLLKHRDTSISWEVRSQGCVQFDLEKYKNTRFLHWDL